ncbi:Senecionine N-oxygenase [Dimargaris verticillata]|uniref:glutaminase n=1 Tax=Dimargaris verticillata TaxID=2761393 RepID=A0A9W8B409_9FUNG|nr:Senecionine N-oxygenase [Dimargaris verticillata]
MTGPATNGRHAAPVSLHLGVLALQGAFAEHIHILQSLAHGNVHISGNEDPTHSSENVPFTVASVRAVRNAEELAAIDGLIIPGGESTTMALIAERTGLWEPLAKFTRTKPTWGTCAGMIMLASAATGTKQGGQRLLQTLPIAVQRNRFGSQLASFEAELDAPCLEPFGLHPFRAVFIRAPVVTALNAPEVQVLAQIDAPVGSDPLPEGSTRDVVAVRRNHCLATAFHPELTGDNRWHHYFVSMVAAYVAQRT